MGAMIDDEPAPMWRCFRIGAGSILKFGTVRHGGLRTYLAVQSGLDSPKYLGSASTFMLGKFGGHAGRSLRAGDVIHITGTPVETVYATLPAAFIPKYEKAWDVAVLYGPHVEPEFFTEADIAVLFGADWQVHYQSDRTGIRLIGPKPEWARKDGGEAGLHPSNIHDNAYAIGVNRLHGRYADFARSRWAELRWICVPGSSRRSRVMEVRPNASGRYGSLSTSD